jgi:ubiquinone biosynthesis protein Coq4
MKKALKRLEKEADKLNAIIVRQEQSSIIMKQFTIVHDAFHDVTGMCNKEEKKEKKDK